MHSQIAVKIATEQLKVDNVTGIGHVNPLKPSPGAQMLQFLACAEPYRVDIHIKSPAYTPAPRHLHRLIILKRIRNKRIRRNRGDRVIPVAHLNRRQRHIDHLPVGVMLRHHNPVTFTKHIVGRKLHTGDKTEDCVLENQHQHRSRCTQGR